MGGWLAAVVVEIYSRCVAGGWGVGGVRPGCRGAARAWAASRRAVAVVYYSRPAWCAFVLCVRCCGRWS